jgi:ferredoxin-NADP reductase
MAMLSHMHGTGSMPEEVRVLYSTRRRGDEAVDGKDDHDIASQVKDVLFSTRLLDIARQHTKQMQLDFFMTDGSRSASAEPAPNKHEGNVSLIPGKIETQQIEKALGDVEGRGEAVCYICGPQKMTDYFVGVVGAAEGMSEERVLCEKWW